MNDPDSELLERLRREMFSDSDGEIYLHIGFFMTWFAGVEFHLTFLLALATTTVGQIENFDLLVQGMDARVKCERLRRALKRFKPMGPNMAARLSHFEQKSIKLRNRLTHSLVTGGKDNRQFHFMSLGQWPEYTKPPKGIPAAYSLPALEFFNEGLWLRAFTEDLSSMDPELPETKILEIENPRSRLPKEFPAGHHPLTPLANVDMHVQTHFGASDRPDREVKGESS